MLCNHIHESCPCATTTGEQTDAMLRQHPISFEDQIHAIQPCSIKAAMAGGAGLG